MSYCSQADIEDFIDNDDLTALTDDEDTGGLNSARIDRSIADATAEIDGYAGKRYSLPFSPVPVIVRKYCVDIAIYNLYARRGGAPEYIRERYNNAILFLKGVASGANSLGADSPIDTPESNDMPVITSNTRVFSRATMEGF